MKRQPGKPLAGVKILDVGCGGGLLTEVSECLCLQHRTRGQKYIFSLLVTRPCPLFASATSHSAFFCNFMARATICFHRTAKSATSFTSRSHRRPSKHQDVGPIFILLWSDWSQFGGRDSWSFTLVCAFVSGDGPWQLRQALRLRLHLSWGRTSSTAWSKKTKSGPWRHWVCGAGCHISQLHTKNQEVSAQVCYHPVSHHDTPSNLKGSSARGFKSAPQGGWCCSVSVFIRPAGGGEVHREIPAFL